jgi:hypothetical protein
MYMQSYYVRLFYSGGKGGENDHERHHKSLSSRKREVKTFQSSRKILLTPSLVAPLRDKEDAKDGSTESSRACLK